MPARRPVTPSPTPSITPAASSPGVSGSLGATAYLPWRKSVSAKFTPIAWVLSSTMPGRTSGLGTSASASTSGPPVSAKTIAFMAFLPRFEARHPDRSPSRPPRADQGIDRLAKHAAVLEGPPHALGLLDLKPADLAGDLLRREQNVRLRGPAPALAEVQQVVAHHEQGAVRPQRVHRVPERRPALGGRELQVEHADQIMGTRRRHPG